MARKLLAIATLALALCGAGGVEAPVLTSVSGDRLALSVGARDGAKVGMTGKVFGQVTVGDRTSIEELAFFQITRVDGTSSEAKRTAGNIPLARGMVVRFDQPLLRPTPEPPKPTPTPRAPTVGEHRSFGPHQGEWTWIPPGQFDMGCMDADQACTTAENGHHPVSLSRGYWLTATEVTAAQYSAFANATGRSMPPAPAFSQGGDHPVVCVTWDDAVAYCRWASGRLPTEAEWERAARGERVGELYPWGARIARDNANFLGTGGRDRWDGTSPVGTFSAGGYGLVDMAGNVWEWVSDWYDSGYYARSPSSDPTGPSDGSSRALRGGSWSNLPGNLRVCCRSGSDPASRHEFVGFRCARDGG